MTAIERKGTEALKKEFEWLAKIINLRIEGIKEGNSHMADDELANPPLYEKDNNYQKFIEEKRIGIEERVAIGLTLVRACNNSLFFPFIENFRTIDYQSKYGGYVDRDLNRFYPTLSTLFFILSGNDFSRWNNYFLHFNSKNFLFLESVLFLEKPSDKPVENNENDITNYLLRISNAYLNYFLGGEKPRLDEDAGFPAYLIETRLSFEDVVHPPQVKESLLDIMKYLRFKEKLFSMPGVRDKFKESYVAIFSGLPGTGKTLTAKTIGKELGIPVYCVSLSRLVSKYIGETEKNLELLFNRFDNQDCILFFDEADALFGKRTDVKDSKDRYANQQINYLLQKIETFKGLIILATNVFDIEGTFDKAFQRRIRRHIHFVHPDQAERLQLWLKALPSSFQYEENLAGDLSIHYQLTGASISNIISDVLVEGVSRDITEINFELIEPFIKIEYSRRNMTYLRATDEEVIKNPALRYGTIVSIDLNKYEGIAEKQKELFLLKKAESLKK